MQTPHYTSTHPTPQHLIQGEAPPELSGQVTQHRKLRLEARFVLFAVRKYSVV